MSPSGTARWRVDTHVFRVANRTGMAMGETPREVEDGLVARIPARYAAPCASLADFARALRVHCAAAGMLAMRRARRGASIPGQNDGAGGEEREAFCRRTSLSNNRCKKLLRLWSTHRDQTLCGMTIIKSLFASFSSEKEESYLRSATRRPDNPHSLWGLANTRSPYRLSPTEMLFREPLPADPGLEMKVRPKVMASATPESSCSWPDLSS